MNDQICKQSDLPLTRHAQHFSVRAEDTDGAEDLEEHDRRTIAHGLG